MSDHHATPVHASAKDQWVDTDATGDHDDLSGPLGSGDRGDTDGHGDHAHGAEDLGLGPIDVTAWGLGVLGVILGGIVAVLMAMSVGML